MTTSEVTRLLRQIEQEYQASKLGLTGLASGTARHQFIEARMHRVGSYEKQLASHIGEEQAILFSCQAYIRIIGDAQ